jgi:hypothetical protein
MTFKVIIRHDSIEDDERTYYGIVGNPGKVKSGRLEYFTPEDKLKVELTFDSSPY